MKTKKEYKMIKKFVSTKYKKYNTQRNYQRHLTNFFNWLEQEPETYLAQQDNNIFKKDIERYLDKMCQDNVPPKSRKGSLAAIKVFMIYYLPDYDKRLPTSVWFKLSHGQYKGSQAIVMDRVPTVETLKKILMGANLRSKALFMTIATSGMRIGEALSITWNDIDFNNKPVAIKLSPEITKTNTGRYVFISDETRDILLEWRDSKEAYAEKRKKSWANRYNPEKVFPFCYQNAITMWWTLLKNSRNTEEDHERYVYHPHALRKFFRSRLAKICSHDYVEFLLGHKTSRDKEYLTLQKEELGIEYLSGMERLLVFQTPADTSDIRESLADKDKQMKEMQESLARTEAELDKIRYEMKLFLKLQQKLDK